MNGSRYPTNRTGNPTTVQPAQPKTDHLGIFLGAVWVLGSIVALGLLGASAVEQPQLATTPNAPLTAVDPDHPVE
ncbi:hypothetical protein [Streptantibioticus ferralitis]|uniref:Uncharacterized protein n=1 Tax=Streptantibioticus ferralitis TaxID=236510 RepID=A0ABT5Z438_9ACTN|nr:hypothetical protein [Streptantibioticus ferralitis]MDF2258597.1 hypothetical protein [Streptantibioticus ferralitis]